METEQNHKPKSTLRGYLDRLVASKIKFNPLGWPSNEYGYFQLAEWIGDADKPRTIRLILVRTIINYNNDARSNTRTRRFSRARIDANYSFIRQIRFVSDAEIERYWQWTQKYATEQALAVQQVAGAKREAPKFITLGP